MRLFYKLNFDNLPPYHFVSDSATKINKDSRSDVSVINDYILKLTLNKHASVTLVAATLLLTLCCLTSEVIHYYSNTCKL